MPAENRNHHEPTADDYRRQHEERAQFRKRQQQRKLLVFGAVGLGAVILLCALVGIFQLIIKPSPAGPGASISVDSGASTPGGTSAAAPLLPHAADPGVWNLVLVNNQKPVQPGFDPELAVVSQNGVGYYFDARITDALKQLLADCNAVEGHSLAITSGYRGNDTQNKRYNDLVSIFQNQGHNAETAAQMAREIDPPAGYSDHQTGLAVDFVTGTVQTPERAFVDTPEYTWLLTNAANYGFILRYPENKAAVTGITFQPYHFRYVGVEDAQAIMAAGISLEEYVSPTDAVPPAASAADPGSDASAA